MARPRNAAASVYLDHASTTPLRPEVEAAIVAAGREGFANPSSQHAVGRRARQLLEESRDRILAAVGGRLAGPVRDRLVFTSGATESNQMAMLGVAPALQAAVATSARDHASLRTAAITLAEERGWSRVDLPLSQAGTLDRDALDAWLDHTHSCTTRLLGTTLVCGQTGILEPLTDLVAGVARRGPCLVHTDATQAVGREAVSFSDLGASTMTFAPHKFGGPRGIGALVIRGDVAVRPLLAGTQETGLRGGTEPVALAAGFAMAIELAIADRADRARRVTGLRDRFESDVLTMARSSGIQACVVGAGARRSPHLSTIAFPGRDRQALVMAADLAGLCCATGTACASGSSEPAPALVAMRLPAETIRGAMRFSFGDMTTEDDIDRAVAILARILA